MSEQSPFAELQKAIREFLSSAERHGQIYDLVPFAVMASIIKIIDMKNGTNYYEAIVNEYIKLSRSAPAMFDTYILKSIKYVSQGLAYKAEIINEAKKKTPMSGWK